MGEVVVGVVVRPLAQQRRVEGCAEDGEDGDGDEGGEEVFHR